METQSYLIIAGLLVIIQTITKIIEIFAKKWHGKKNGNPHSDHTLMTEMWNILKKTDENGSPLCYYPRGDGDKLDVIIGLLRDIKDKVGK